MALSRKSLHKTHFFDEVSERIVALDICVCYYKTRERGERILIESVFRSNRKLYRLGRVIEFEMGEST